MHPTPAPVSEMDTLLSQLLSHGLSLSDISSDAPLTVNYEEPSGSYDGGHPQDEDDETFVVLVADPEKESSDMETTKNDSKTGPDDGAIPSVSVTIPLPILASLLAQLDEARDLPALIAYSALHPPSGEAPTLATAAVDASSSDVVPTPIVIQPAGPIPPEARAMMSTRTLAALDAMDLDTVPADPHTGYWYCVTQGTWIGLNNEWVWVSPHVVGIPRNCYLKLDDWYQAREKFLLSRNMGVCRLLSKD